MSGPQHERGTFNQSNLDDSEPLESATDLNKSNALLGAVIGASLAASLVVRPESSRTRRAIEFSTVALSGLVGAAAVNWQPTWPAPLDLKLLRLEPLKFFELRRGP